MSRPVTLLTLLVVLVGAAVAVSIFAATRTLVVDASLTDTSADRRPLQGDTRSTTAAKPRAGNLVPVDQAIKELNLVRPSRSKAAEDFTLSTLDGKKLRLRDQRGKVVFVNFWATWCPPCREEMPAMERLYQQHKNQGFVMMAVSLDGDSKVVPPFVKEHGFTFPVALDPGMDVANAYGVRALPSSFVIDPEGQVVGIALGSRAWDGKAAHALIEAMLR
jgi:peroxiredoxin